MEVLPICLCFMVIREVDPHKLGLNDHPVVIPAATTALSSGLFEGLEKAYALGKGKSPFRSLSHWRLGSCIGGPILMWMLILRGGPVR